jgi:hypothetical protein
MSDFEILPADRPGIEKAAKWHDWQAQRFNIDMQKRSAIGGNYWADRACREFHRCAARDLRALLSRSSLPPGGGGVPSSCTGLK